MRTTNGITRRVSSRTAAASLPSHSQPVPGIWSGASATTAITTRQSPTASPRSMRRVRVKSVRPAPSPSSSSTAVNAVWKLVDSAPSPRKRRNRFGTRQAVMKAS